MWSARTKNDLIIEVWEKLNCENVGAVEIEAIEVVIGNEYGESAVDSPMVIARLLADEGAELRHSEIMKLFLERASDRPYDAALRNVVRLDGLGQSLGKIRDLENLRKKFGSDGDKTGLRLLRESAIEAKRSIILASEDPKIESVDRQIKKEIGQWLSVWLQTPEMFADWVELRQRSSEFVETFGKIGRTE